MSNRIRKTDERLAAGTNDSVEEYLLILRHEFAYHFAADRIAKDANVLDVGCGTGYGASILAARGVRVLGVDVSAPDLAHARTQVDSERCTFAVFDGQRLPVRDRWFAAVTVFQVIEHVIDDAGFVEELARVLSPGGCLFLTTPNKSLRLDPSGQPWNRFHVREYSAAELSALLTPHFRTVSILGVTGSDEVRNVEEARIRSARTRARLDPLNLRWLVPAEWVPPLMSIYKRGLSILQPGRADRDFGRFGVADFRALDSNVPDSLDLLAVCSESRTNEIVPSKAVQ